MLSGSQLFKTLNFYIQGHEFCLVGEGKSLKDFKQRKKVKNEAKKSFVSKKYNNSTNGAEIIHKEKNKNTKEEPWPICHTLCKN